MLFETKSKYKKTQLSTAYKSARHLPVNFSKEDKAIFQHEAVCEINPCYLIQIKNILYKGYGLVQVSLKRSLPEPFLLYNFIQRLPFFRFLYYLIKQRLLRNIETIKGPVVFVVDHWSYGYFHWIAEVLPRIIAAKNKTEVHPVILPEKFKKLSFVSDSLKQIGIKFRFLDDEKLYKLKHAFFISHFCETGNYNDEVIRLTRKALLANVISSEKNHCVYISRMKASKRNIINEEELLEFLKALNFKIIYCEDLTFSDQQSIFSGVKLLISNHGAGLTNMLFMEDNSNILEIRNKIDTHNNCYFSLASALNLNYYYLKAEPGCLKENTHVANILVDIPELKSVLHSILNN